MGDPYDDNPFAESSTNPFEDNSSSYSSPSAYSSQRNEPAMAFEPEPTQPRSSTTSSKSPTTAPSKADDPYRSSWNNASSTASAGVAAGAAMGSEAIRMKEQELQRREEELLRRERELEERLRMLPKPRPPNWPICRPVIHHDVTEMPTPQTVAMVRRAYYGWYAICWCLFVNMIGMTAALAVGGGKKSSGVGDFILSIVFLIFCPLMAFLVYRLLYNAARKSKPSLYILWFFFFTVEMLVMLFFIFGIESTGASGFMWMVSLFDDDKAAAGIVIAIALGFWMFTFGYGFWLIYLAWKQYKQSGGAEQAKREFATEAVKRGVV